MDESQNTDDRRSMFVQRYEEQNVPWDTGITPPEIEQVVQELAPGRALDLGCGTGTNVRYLLEHGWQADGVDFVPQAIEQARTQLADFPPESYAVYCHDVTRLNEITGLRSPYDLVIDIGCGHNLPLEQAEQYVHDIASLMKPGAIWMLYAHLPSEERTVGWAPEDVRRIFSPKFELVWQMISTEPNGGHPSGWYRLARRED